MKPTRGVTRAGKPDRLIDTAIGARVRSLRLEKGISQAVLARQIGVTFQQLQKYERGENRVSAGRLQVIADALDVPAAELMHGAPSAAAPGTEVALSSTPVPLPERQSLLAAYMEIPDVEVRRGVRRLVRALADLCNRQAAPGAGSLTAATPQAQPRPGTTAAEAAPDTQAPKPPRRAG